MTQEVLKLALEFLEDNQHYITDNENHLYLMMYNNVIEKCKKALAQQEQEPVAYLHQCEKKPELKELSFKKNEPALSAKGYKSSPLSYTAPPQRTEQEPVKFEQS